MKIAFSKPEPPASGSYVVAVLEDRKLAPAASALDKKTGGVITRAMAATRFKGKKNELLDILAPKGVPFARIVLMGLGKLDKLDTQGAEALGGKLVEHLNKVGESLATVSVEQIQGSPVGPAEMAAHLAMGAKLRAYRFDKYKTREKEDAKPTLKSLNLLVTDVAAARKVHGPLDRVADAIHFTRDIVSEPPNVIYPESLAERCKRLAAFGVKVEIFDEKQLEKLGAGALLGVGQGSARPSRMVILRYEGAPKAKDKRPVAFVGKGVTFDTGGISIKPSAGMEDMKWDMAGSAAVIGTIEALAARHAKVNAIGAVGLVENMPSGTAQRPSDIVKSMSGKTIEVLNTDAEGRLVLADVLWYVHERFKPKAMVDLATLTGAVIIALGHEYAGIMANDDGLADKLIAAGKATGEPLWRLPLGEAYDRDIDSPAADVKNIAAGRGAGSIIGGQFLARFVGDTPWAHLDIAGTAWSTKDKPTCPKGATAFGVRLLDRFVADSFEEK
ncbi:MAG: leucyl aminopeptidase [Azospirillum sp.]|nr:leucyl aminopeptidase [Azospirillum sp.]MCZ8123910.1 leucyl aminopeptidase [Magnetospirillum sp.]